MTADLYFKGDLSHDPHELLKQQGRSWLGAHREIAIADAGSLDILVDVKSSYHGTFEFQATGVFHGTFHTAASASSGAATSLDVFNMNSFFQATTSGNFTTEVSHTGSYGTLSKCWDFIVGAGAGGPAASPIGGKSRSSLILGPGLYVFTMQNKSGGAADLNFTASWEEVEVPNIPA